ncbi:MAG: nitroreductase family protein [Bacillota bacterium]|nr:nitroreductase family protein [Bacillota bacterium]
MDIFDIIKKRVSVRAYKKDPIDIDTVRRLIEYACMAPSWGNKQCWRFIIVDSNVEKNLLGKASGQPIIAQACIDAPYVVALCANTKESGVKNGVEYYAFDSALAMENLVLAAEAEGLATCIVGWFDEKVVKGILNIPKDIKVLAFTPLGFSGEIPKPSTRKKLEQVVYYNSWGKEEIK